MGVRTLAGRLGEETAAEPVPVRRPGVCAMGVEGVEGREIGDGAQIGRMKTGLNLKQILGACDREDGRGIPECEP